MDASYAADRVKRPHLIFRYRARAAMAARCFREFGRADGPARILDLGSADGRAMIELHELLRARESVGVEYAGELIAAAPPMPKGCSLTQGDATKPQAVAAAGSFDLVTALAVLEHLEDPTELMRRAREALRPGGVFVASCPSGLWDRISGSLGLHKDEHHTGDFNRARFESCARAAGLEPLRYRRFMFAPVGFLPYAKVPVPVGLALAIDAVLAPIPLVNLGMVNQIFAARRPEGGGA
jgi:SAM-dependent methyltransferase